MVHQHGNNWKSKHWLADWGKLFQFYILSYNNRMEAQKVQYQKQLQGKKIYVRPNALLDFLEKLRAKTGIN